LPVLICPKWPSAGIDITRLMYSASPSQFLVVISDGRWQPCSHSDLGTRILDFPLVDDVTPTKLPNMNQGAWWRWRAIYGQHRVFPVNRVCRPIHLSIFNWESTVSILPRCTHRAEFWKLKIDDYLVPSEPVSIGSCNTGLVNVVCRLTSLQQGFLCWDLGLSATRYSGNSLITIGKPGLIVFLIYMPDRSRLSQSD
jgi:hypothetical protein